MNNPRLKLLLVCFTIVSLVSTVSQSHAQEADPNAQVNAQIKEIILNSELRSTTLSGDGRYRALILFNDILGMIYGWGDEGQRIDEFFSEKYREMLSERKNSFKVDFSLLFTEACQLATTEDRKRLCTTLVNEQVPATIKNMEKLNTDDLWDAIDRYDQSVVDFFAPKTRREAIAAFKLYVDNFKELLATGAKDSQKDFITMHYQVTMAGEALFMAGETEEFETVRTRRTYREYSDENSIGEIYRIREGMQEAVLNHLGLRYVKRFMDAVDSTFDYFLRNQNEEEIIREVSELEAILNSEDIILSHVISLIDNLERNAAKYKDYGGFDLMNPPEGVRSKLSHDLRNVLTKAKALVDMPFNPYIDKDESHPDYPVVTYGEVDGRYMGWEIASYDEFTYMNFSGFPWGDNKQTAIICYSSTYNEDTGQIMKFIGVGDHEMRLRSAMRFTMDMKGAVAKIANCKIHADLIKENHKAATPSGLAETM